MNLFVDRDLGKRLGKALRLVGVRVTNHIDRYPGADAESVPDRTWIVDAAVRGEVIVTRDGGIRRVAAELEAVVNAGARCFVLETGNASAFDYLRAIMIAWPAMKRAVEQQSAPFMYGINRNGRLRRRFPEPVSRAAR